MTEKTEHRTSSAPQATTDSFRRGTPADSDAVDRIDESFTTSTIFDVRDTGAGFALVEITVPEPIVKRFPDDVDDDADESVRFVAVDQGGEICGAIDILFEEWNGRLTIADIRVAPNRRGVGLGRQLVGLAVEHGRELGAHTLWLEVTNINAPAIKAYLRMGFTFCGLDTSLYRGTPSDGEIAIFMSRDLGRG
ncbi:GNAT family N-acetyltransferase [Nocardia cyriacigeorgica]|uniref:GNAT family N-acetyltransferase n=1 Tax=Nocardia cyriacigeorgica TaxID=135487 RepID=UPI002458D5E1|nr:GNAT family N-acetyltransferase [Nocardia cyriacigeorgica]